MMPSTPKSLSLVLLVGTFLATMSWAEEPVKAGAVLTLAASSWLRIDGDSTLHKYRVETRQLQAAFQIEAPTTGASTQVEDLVRANAIKGLVLTIPVAGLHSGEDGLDDNLRKALSSDKHPNITWRLDSYEVKASSSSGSALDLTLHGHLTVAGVERTVDLSMKGVPEPNGLRLTGQQNLSMHDYGVQPPVLFLGALKTADQVVIGFNLLLESSTSRP